MSLNDPLTLVDYFDRNTFAIRRHPTYDDSYLLGDRPFLRTLGVDPSVETEIVFAWGDPEPIRVRTISLEEIEALYGVAIVPLCERQIPAVGTE